MNFYTIYMMANGVEVTPVIQVEGIDYTISENGILTIIGPGMRTSFVCNWFNVRYMEVDHSE